MSGIYHEKQSLQFCAVHAINNLFQDGTTCSKYDLDSESYTLTPRRWNNPHRSILGIGNYDINVIMSFLKKKKFDVIWFDKRKSVNCILPNEVFGFLLNTVSPLRIMGKSISIDWFKHWSAVKKLNGLFYNLDSKLENPMEIGDGECLKQYLKDQLNDTKTELLLVVEVERTQSDVLTPDYIS